MGILNLTPDSFSDGGRFASLDAAVSRAEGLVNEGAEIIDIGGESTRPGSRRTEATVEIDRTAPIIEAIAARFDVPISIDTSKSTVAKAAIAAGAEIINDISGLRFDERIVEVAARYKTGLVLMHSRGDFETMHSQSPVDDIFSEVESDFRRALATSIRHGVEHDRIVLDVGIGFGKTMEQNLELIARLNKIGSAFSGYPLLIGASRKSFIGKLLGGALPENRLSGSLAAAVVSVSRGARIIRTHDVKQTVDAIKVANAILQQS
jgi:dihydropteroate synthase